VTDIQACMAFQLVNRPNVHLPALFDKCMLKHKIDIGKLRTLRDDGLGADTVDATM